MVEDYKKKANTGDDVFIRIQAPERQDAAPTVVLLGWFAASAKHVAKYASEYEKMGYNSVVTTAPFSVAFPLNPKTTAMFVVSILRILVSDSRLLDGGVVFHMFSNGGAMCAPHLSRLFEGLYPELVKDDDEIVVATVKRAMTACVFDSAPVFLRAELGARAINEGLRISNGVVAMVVAFVFTMMCWVQQRFILDLPIFFWEGLRHAVYGVPEFYMYSRVDHLLDVPALEALILERRKRGEQVSVWAVDDAMHVRLLLKYPSVYREKLRDINETAVNAWRKRQHLPDWDTDKAQPRCAEDS